MAVATLTKAEPDQLTRAEKWLRGFLWFVCIESVVHARSVQPQNARPLADALHDNDQELGIAVALATPGQPG